MIQADGKVTIEHGAVDERTGRRATSIVERDKIWPIDDGLVGQTVRQGEQLICRTDAKSRLWLPCQVTAIAAEHLGTEDHRGTAHQLDLRSVVRPDKETAAVIAELLALEARHRQFDKAFTEAGSPYRPKNWKPTKGAEVVARWEATSYYGARVLEMKDKGKKIRVTWEGKTLAAMDLDALLVAPRSADAPPLSKDQFVLVRPARKSQLWEHCKVTAVAGEQLVVVNRDDEKRTVGIADVIAIVKPDR